MEGIIYYEYVVVAEDDEGSCCPAWQEQPLSQGWAQGVALHKSLSRMTMPH